MLMKRLFLAVIFIALLSNTYALDTSCLQLKSQPITVNAGETIQVENSSEIYPFQGDALVPIKWITA
jgi:hypothetical protein